MDEKIKNIVKTFFDMAMGEDSYSYEDDDLIYYDKNPKSGLDSWVRLDKNSQKALTATWKNMLERYEVNEHGDIVDNSSYVYPKRPSILTALMFRVMFISKYEDKALKKMKAFNRGRYEMGMYEETIVEYNGVNYYVIWD